MDYPYTEYQYLYPPRPETAMPPTSLAFMADKGYGAQVKKNGTCTVIFARGREVIFKTRHPEQDDGNHKAWKPLPEHVAFFANRSTKWNVYVAELLHNKTPGIKNQLFIHDILVHEGEQLVGETMTYRAALLIDTLGVEGVDEGDQLRVTPYISIAKTFTDNFQKVWDNLKPEDEGLVLKRMDAPLNRCIRRSSNSSWQVKIRRPATNYTF